MSSELEGVRPMVTEAELLRAEAARLKTETPISVTELFTIGIGPSSSHTVGPMRAAYRFVESLGAARQQQVTRMIVELYGSLALTGKGHATDSAVILGLLGWQPETVDPEQVPALLEQVRTSGTLQLAGRYSVAFSQREHLLFRMGEFLPGHPNAVRFSAQFADAPAFEQQWYSIGGGAIVLDGAVSLDSRPGSNLRQSFPFSSAEELLALGRRHRLSIAQIVLANEQAWRDEAETRAFLDRVRLAMLACIDRGCRQGGTLPGGLNVRRRGEGTA